MVKNSGSTSAEIIRLVGNIFTTMRFRPPRRFKRIGGQQFQAADRQHRLRPVDQRQPFLRREDDRLQSGAAQSFAARHNLPVQFGAALAHDDERDVR